MGRGLYEGDPLFRSDVDECSAILRPQLDLELRDVLYPEPGAEELAEKRLAQTEVTQPALFVIEYALAQAWRRLGIEPDGMIGHSVGEYVAACLGGVFTRDDALKLVAERARLMQTMPEGAMLAVRASGDTVLAMLPDGLEIAAENAPGSTVVSGETSAIEDFEAHLAEHGLAARRLATSHAFHSAMMDPILEDFADVVDTIPRSAPVLPWISSLTGDWITQEQAQDSAYWVQQVRRPVLFAKGVTRLLEDPTRVTLEVGPGQQLTGLAKRSVPDRPVGVVTLATAEGQSTLLLPAGGLWAAGVTLPADILGSSARGGRRVPLPSYPFERERYWVEPRPHARLSAGSSSAPGDNQPVVIAAASPGSPSLGRRELLGERIRDLFADLSGMDGATLDPDATFLELGLDSLLLTQAALLLQKTFDVKVSFRDLLDNLSTIDALATHLDGVLPGDAGPAPAPVAPASTVPVPGERQVAATPSGSVERLIVEQLEIMRQQLEMLRGGGGDVASTASVPQPAIPGAPGESEHEVQRAEARPGARVRPVPPAVEGPSGRADGAAGARPGFLRRSLHAAHRRFQGLHGGEPRASRRSPLRVRLSAGVEGDRVPHRHGAFRRLPALGPRRERVRRSHQRLRDDHVRAQPRLHSSMPSRPSSLRESRPARSPLSPETSQLAWLPWSEWSESRSATRARRPSPRPSASPER